MWRGVIGGQIEPGLVQVVGVITGRGDETGTPGRARTGNHTPSGGPAFLIFNRQVAGNFNPFFKVGVRKFLKFQGQFSPVS